MHRHPTATVPATPVATHYANFQSWLLMRRVFQDQWVLPVPGRTWTHRFFRWYETHAMRICADSINIDRPIFIISLPRSGSSMLQDLLCAHPQAAYITNMMHLFPDCFCAAEHFRKKLGLDVRGERFLQDSVNVGGGSPADPVGMWAAWMKQDPFALEPNPHSIRDYTTDELEKIRADIRRILWCFGGDGRRFVCKTPALLPYILTLRDIFPNARFIHLIRDARPNANSMLKLHRLCDLQWQRIRARHPRAAAAPETFIPYPRLPETPALIRRFGADDLRTTAHLWNAAMSFMADAQKQIAPAQFYEVRYEDIVARPADEISRLLQFLELPPPGDDCAAFHARLANIGRIHHQNNYGGFDLITEICGPALRQHGYL